MKDWMDNSVQRWNELRIAAEQRAWPPISELTVTACGRSVGVEWFASRSSDVISDFLAMNGAALLSHPSFGRIKVARLISIVAACLENDMPSLGASEECLRTDSRSALEGLKELAIPADLPLGLVRLPVRIKHYCEEHHLLTLGELLEAWETVGERYFFNLPNLGKKSVGELRDLWRAACQCNSAALRPWLPVDPIGYGLSLVSGLTDEIGAMTQRDRLILERRLVNRQTLEDAAAAFNVTRERTRQLEARLLGQLAMLLDRFPDSRDRMVALWMEGRPFMDSLSIDLPTLDLKFIEAAVERIFQERPEGAARGLSLETQIEKWHDRLKEHPDLLVDGVDLDEFMRNEVPEDQQETLCLSLDGRGRIRLDHKSGRVVHASPGLREVVKAVLAREDDAIPLTWLHHLVTQTPTHQGVTRDQIFRYRIQWKSDDPSFPRDKVLWNL